MRQNAPLRPVQVIDGAENCPELPIVIGDGHAKAVVWPGNGAEHRSMHLISLNTGATSIALSHRSDCVYYVLEGSGKISDLASGGTQPLVEGSMIHIDAGDAYQLRTDAGPFRILGGPCPADNEFYTHLAEG